MGFQTQVGLYREIGIPGARATNNPVIFLPYTPLANDDGDISCKVGGFVWADTADADNQRVKPTGTGAPLAFATRVQRYFNYVVTSTGTQIIPQDGVVEPAIKGDFFAVALTAAVVGQKVFVATADGSLLKTDAAGATVTDYEETDYFVETAAEIGDTFIMSNWRS